MRKSPAAIHKLLARPSSIQHAELQDEEAEAAPEKAAAPAEDEAAADAAPADEAAPAEAAAPAETAQAPAATAEAKPDGIMGTMSEFAPHLDKIHWPAK